MSPALPDNIQLNKKIAGGMAYKRKRKGGVNIISLLTDFGLGDNFVGVMKAAILRINPRALIVDICHQIKPHDILQAAFLLKSSFKYFPKGSIHLVVVDPQVGSKRKSIIVRTKDYLFVGPDNGVLSLALKGQAQIQAVTITNSRYFLKPVSDTFYGRDVFSPVAAHLSKGAPLYRFGKSIKSFKTLELPKVKITCKSLTGEVIYIDHFGNLISNIDKDSFENFTGNKKFKISLKKKIIDKLFHSYSEGTQYKPVALIDSFNYLEIALNSASAKDYLGVDRAEKITIMR